MLSDPFEGSKQIEGYTKKGQGRGICHYYDYVKDCVKICTRDITDSIRAVLTFHDGTLAFSQTLSRVENRFAAAFSGP